MDPLMLDLSAYTDAGVGVLAGRERGERVRREAGLDRADREGQAVQVVIPDDVDSVNSSFFLGLFEKSIFELGADEFRRRYSFLGIDAEDVRDEGIRMALLIGSPLGPHT